MEQQNSVVSLDTSIYTLQRVIWIKDKSLSNQGKHKEGMVTVLNG